MTGRCIRLPELRAAFRLDGSGGSVSAARGCARAYLEQCNPPLPQDVAADALVVISESVTNAISHALGPCCLYLVEDDDELTIAVSDESIVPPVPRTPAPDIRPGCSRRGVTPRKTTAGRSPLDHDHVATGPRTPGPFGD